jgi:ArsR family transcriptional regulator
MAQRLVRRSLGEGGRLTNVEWKRGELEKLPIKDATVDVALLSQVLHHASSPEKAMSEAARIVKPGGRVLLLELRRHQEQWVRERLGDQWLGFEDGELKQLVENAGLTDVKVTVGARRQRDPFTVLIASGVKAGTRHGGGTKTTKITKATKAI